MPRWAWVTTLVALLLLAGGAWGYHRVQIWIDRAVHTRTAEIAQELDVVRQESAKAKLDLERERAALAGARRDADRAKADAARASAERDAAVQSAAAAAAAREDVHANVAQVPDREVRRRLRGGLGRLGLLPHPGSGG